MPAYVDIRSELNTALNNLHLHLRAAGLEGTYTQQLGELSGMRMVMQELSDNDWIGYVGSLADYIPTVLLEIEKRLPDGGYANVRAGIRDIQRSIKLAPRAKSVGDIHPVSVGMK